MKGKLECSSFHSVKGGVGKSTLAVAHALAATRRAARVVLVDLDLTGTSLADVLPLCAPRWEPTQYLRLGDTVRPPPSGEFYTRAETRELIRLRDDGFNEFRNDADAYAPFLNDFLLFQPPDRGEPEDMAVEALLWRMEGAPDNLRVIPSSALPLDLERMLPVIFDEYHSAFIEARLEVLLDGLLAGGGETVVVVDVPPTIPGLSRTVMSLCIRLTREPKVELADDGAMPPRLADAAVHWRCHLVVSEDVQDLRAASRWLWRLREDERPYVRLLVNRHIPGRSALEVQERVREKLRTKGQAPMLAGDSAPPGAAVDRGDWREELTPFIETLVAVKQRDDYQFFREEEAPALLEDPLPPLSE